MTVGFFGDRVRGRASTGRWRRSALAVVVLAGTLGSGAPAVAQVSPPPAEPGDLEADALAAELGEDWYTSADVVVHATMDEEGYHLYTGLEREGFAWRPLATIRPGGGTDWDWTGYHCRSASGRYVAAVVAPAAAANRPAMRDRGAMAYVIDIETQEVSPVVAGVALKYHTPGCGADDMVAFSRNLGENQAQTEAITVDMATRTVTRTDDVAGQVTSILPTDAGPVGAMGTTIVRLGGEEPEVLATVPEAPFSLATSSEGIDFLTMGGWDAADDESSTGATTATAWNVPAGGGEAEVVARGPAADLRLYDAAASVVLVGATEQVAIGERLVLDAPAAPAEAVSREADLLLAEGDATAPLGVELHVPATGAQLERSDPGTGTVAEDLPTASGPRSRSRPTPRADTSTPVCAVPRNDPSKQAFQATNEQIDWAVKQASAGNLGSISTEFQGPSYAGLPGLRVPALVMNGVLAQESAYRHASRRALPGLGGNPSISDYYGTGGASIDVFDYDDADCGYGVAQVTTGMRADEVNTPYSASQQARIATDYKTNIAAGMKILRTK
ncbi:MAG TPA: hypothetical protein VK507_04335, partial [Iamia sp.]|nr:hypothetical protein [Iamia sp.]